MHRFCDHQYYCAEVVSMRLRGDKHCPPPRTHISSLRHRKCLAPTCTSYELRLGRKDFKDYLAASLMRFRFAPGASAQTGPSTSHSLLSTYNKDEIELVFSSHSTGLGRFRS